MNEPLSKSEFIKKLNTDIQFNKKYGRAPKKNGEMVLPPCHYGFQVWTRELSLDERIMHFLNKGGNPVDLGVGTKDVISKEESIEKLDKQFIPKRAISLLWNQRSCDFPLGVPINISSYALLLIMLADEMRMIPEELIGNFGDCHIYENQIEGVKEQLKREPRELPTLHVRDGMYSGGDEDFILENYNPHPTIKFPLSN